MLGQEFCNFLEYQLSKSFGYSIDDSVRHFWCDGILLPYSETEYSKKYVNDKRQISLTAFAGLSGQDRFELVLKFGQIALSKYARDIDITDCVPDPENRNAFSIDIEEKRMWIQLI